MKHKDVEDAVVIAREEEKGDIYLCAYVVSDSPLGAVELRDYLSGRVPGHMVPTYFVRLEEIPLLPNGKVNLRAFPAPGASGLANTAAYVGPETETEHLVAGVWGEVLGLEKVGVLDNFFDIGGNSLKIIRVSSRLKEELKREIPVMKIFEYPTVREFSRYLQAGKREDQSSAVSKQPHSAASSGDIAVIGMAGRFSGARAINEFRNRLNEGDETVSLLSP